MVYNWSCILIISMEDEKKGKGKLSKKPLAEAIFELRWELSNRGPGIFVDPNYKLVLGSFFEKIKDKYGYPEGLPSSSMPEEFAAYVVQQRFRKDKDGWPLVQLGPGILTYNQTGAYDWNEFKAEIETIVGIFAKSYPNSEAALKIKDLKIRYINAFEFNHSTKNILSFLKDRMKTKIELPKSIFEKTKISESPNNYNFFVTFESSKPAGEIMMRFAKGTSEGKEALIWELGFATTEEKTSLEEINEWLVQAHDSIDVWFFGITEGKLFESFI